MAINRAHYQQCVNALIIVYYTILVYIFATFWKFAQIGTNSETFWTPFISSQKTSIDFDEISEIRALLCFALKISEKIGHQLSKKYLKKRAATSWERSTLVDEQSETVEANGGLSEKEDTDLEGDTFKIQGYS